MNIKQVNLEEYKYGASEDMSDFTEQECAELLDKMKNPQVEARIKKLMRQDDGGRRVKAHGMVK